MKSGLLDFKRANRGFTLIELLVVVAIIAVLASLLLPALSHAKASAISAQCKSNLRQMGISLAMYVGESQGQFPPINSSFQSDSELWRRAVPDLYRCPTVKSDDLWLRASQGRNEPINMSFGMSYGYIGARK